MKAVLLAAGLGTRLKPLTVELPKCLAPIDGQPLMSYWIDSLKRCGVNEVLVNMHSHADQVQEFINHYDPSGFVQTVYEKELLGTGGTLLRNHSFFGNDPLLVIHADNLCFANLSAFTKAHNARPARTMITMLTFVTSFPEDAGIVELDEEGIVRCLHEKIPNAPGKVANGAVYIFEPTVLVECIRRNYPMPVDLSTQVLPSFLGRIFSWPTDGLHIDVGTPQRLKEAQLLVQSLRNTSNWPVLFIGILRSYRNP